MHHSEVNAKSSPSSNAFQRRQNYHRKHGVNLIKFVKPAQASSPILRLPVEACVHIFALLPAQSLAVVSAVCQRWYAIITDDSAWREAFWTNYGVPRGHLENPTSALGRRVNSGNWKLEYVTRTQLLKYVNGQRFQSTPPQHF